MSVSRLRMNKVGGYQRLFDLVERLGMPDRTTLEAILSMATHGGGRNEQNCSSLIRNIEPITYLLKWIADSDFENHLLQVWLQLECTEGSGAFDYNIASLMSAAPFDMAYCAYLTEIWRRMTLRDLGIHLMADSNPQFQLGSCRS